MFNCDKIEDKILNSVIYRSSFCVVIYTSYKLLKIVRFL